MVLPAQLKNYKRVFEHILDMEKKVDQANKNLVNCLCYGNSYLFNAHLRAVVKIRRRNYIKNC